MAKKYTAKEARKMILDVATHLFVAKGYEKTSIQDIVNGLDGLTRGAVYHHFASKDDIIIGVARRFIPEEEELLKIDERDDLSGLEKLQTLLIENMFSETTNESKGLAYPLLNDPKFYAIYIRQMTLVLAPQIERYIIAGNQDGSTKVPQPAQMAEIIILLISTWFIEELYPNTAETFFEKLSACQYVLAQSGVDVLSEGVLETILIKLNEKVAELN